MHGYTKIIGYVFAYTECLEVYIDRNYNSKE